MKLPLDLRREPAYPGSAVAPHVERKQVEACIARRGWRLSFPPPLEGLFEEETGPRRCRSLVRMGLFGLAIMQMLLLPLWLLIGDVFARVLWVQLGLVTPLCLLTLWLIWRQPRPCLREMCIVVAVVVATAALTWLTLESASATRWAIPQMFMLPVLYVSAMQRLRFVPAALACALLLLLGLVLIGHLPQFQGGVFIAMACVFLGSLASALWGNYVFERQERLGYLYSLLTRLQNSELDRISRFDALTGLGNRRLLDEVVLECRAGGVSRLAIIMIDLDHFKKLNDALGHQAGDQCLVRVAGLVQGALRDHRDHAFRYGGEEFLVLLRDASRDTAAAVAERIRAAIEAAGIPNPGLHAGAGLTASLGISLGALGAGNDIERLVASADAALYGAKHAGRNQVAWQRD